MSIKKSALENHGLDGPTHAERMKAMSTKKHTPTPWKVKNGKQIYTANEMQAVAFVHDIAWPHGNHPSSYEVEANAAFIVRACNSHEALVAALEEALQAAKDRRPAHVGKLEAALKLAKEA